MDKLKHFVETFTNGTTTTLIGERHDPEIIAPISKIRSMVEEGCVLRESRRKENDVERRFLKFKIRAVENDDGTKSRTVRGHASVTEVWSEAGVWFREKIAKGAFLDAIPRSDVKALLNHDPNHLLARKRTAGDANEHKNTLEIWEDEKGLAFKYDIPESRNDILESIERGDLDDNSFAFTVENETWEERDGTDVIDRTINKVNKIYDVSPVTYPFYEGTDLEIVSTNTIAEKRFNEYKEQIKSVEKPTQREGNLTTLDREIVLLKHDL